ncbi:hypothetical protein [Brevibacterium luteolum]|nr:hypothetical protein [Brevibacterium luteolum]MCT1658238.1 hypothetical protein [Brevibacterium luteolum]
MSMPENVRRVSVESAGPAEDLGFLAQSELDSAAESDIDYRLIGGFMVRLLLAHYPVTHRSMRVTRDADATVGTVEAVGSLVTQLRRRGFENLRANQLVKHTGRGQQLEINVLLPSLSPNPGLSTRNVPGVGLVDALPELTFALSAPAIDTEVDVRLSGGQTLLYRTKIPDVETAVILKLLSWSSRRSDADLSDLALLLEIREEHPSVTWSLDDGPPRGYRLDAARVSERLTRYLLRTADNSDLPTGFDRYRCAELLTASIASP